MKTGLVMEGGSMRGMFTSGVIDVFMENGITFDGAIGVSAGATFGCNIKSKQIGRAYRYYMKYRNDYRFGSFKSLVKSGDFFDVDFCYHKVPEVLDVFDTDAFTKNPMEFYVVATDVLNGKALYHKCFDGKTEDIEWIRASASVPLVSRIVEIDGYKLLDGGIADSVPIKYFEEIGYDRNVIILTQAYDFVKKKNKMVPLSKIIYRKYPEYNKIFENRYIRYNETYDYIKEKEKTGELFVIRPPYKLPVSSAEKDEAKLKEAYEMGRKEALIAINERNLGEYLKGN